MNPALKWVVPLILILTMIAALAGVWPAQGTPYWLTTFRAEQVTMNARGLYYWDTVSMATQMQANDLIALVLGLPLLAASFWLTLRGSLRGRIILAGTLGFILYTYITMAFGAQGVHRAQVLMEHPAIEEEQGAEGLVLGGSGDVLLVGALLSRIGSV